MNLLFLTQTSGTIEHYRNNKYTKISNKIIFIIFSKDIRKTLKFGDVIIEGIKWSLLKKYYQAIKICSYYIRTNRIDLINIDEPLSGLFIGYYLKIKYNIPISVDVRMPIFENYYNENIKVVFGSFIIKMILKKADSLRAMCRKHKEMLENKLRISEDKIYVIPPCNLLADFKKDFKIQDVIKTDTKSHKLLFVGRFAKQKDLKTLLLSIKIVKEFFPNVICTFVGDGPERKKINSWISKLSLNCNIEMPGKIPHHLLMKFFSECDIFVLSSVRESLGVVLLEAAGAQKAVVTTNTIGAQELIQDGYNGFVVPLKNYKNFAEKIIFLLKEPKLRIEMGKNNLKYIKKSGFYDFDDCLPLVKQMWEKTAYNYGK